MFWSPSGVSTNIGVGCSPGAQIDAEICLQSSAVLACCIGLARLGTSGSLEILGTGNSGRIEKFLIQPETESPVVAAGFLARKPSLKDARMTFFGVPGSAGLAKGDENDEAN